MLQKSCWMCSKLPSLLQCLMIWPTAHIKTSVATAMPHDMTYSSYQNFCRYCNASWYDLQLISKLLSVLQCFVIWPTAHIKTSVATAMPHDMWITVNTYFCNTCIQSNLFSFLFTIFVNFHFFVNSFRLFWKREICFELILGDIVLLSSQEIISCNFLRSWWRHSRALFLWVRIIVLIRFKFVRFVRFLLVSWAWFVWIAYL